MQAFAAPTTPSGPVVSKWTFSPLKKKIASGVAAVAVLGTTAAVIGSQSNGPLDSHVASTGAGACSGVAYDSYQAGSADQHFAVIKSKFSNVRTYQTLVEGTSRGSVNLIDAGAKAGLGMACGLWNRMGDEFFKRDLEALVDGIKRNPGTCQQVYVGNEDLVSGFSKATLISRIWATKSALKAAGLNVPVGTVETDATMKSSSNEDLAAACDVIGINVYPYSTDANIGQLTTRFNEVASKYPGRVHLTETGWPSEGNYKATFDKAKKYFFDYQEWKKTNGGECPYYFQFHDVSVKHGDECHFGLSADGATWKFDVPPAPAPPPPTTAAPPTPAPTTAAPTTDAPTTAPPPTAPPTTVPPTAAPPTTAVVTSTPPPPEPTTTIDVYNSTNAITVEHLPEFNTTINSTTSIIYSVDADATGELPTDESESLSSLPSNVNGAVASPAAGAKAPASGNTDKDTLVSTSSGDTSDNTGSIVGGILGGAVGVAAVAAVIMFAIRNRRNMSEEKERDFDQGDFFVDSNRGSQLTNWQREGSVAVL